MSQMPRFLARLGLLLFIFQYCQVVQASSGFSGTINLGKAAEGISIQNSPQSYTKTGLAIADLGDVNGDGYSDVGIGSGCYFYVIFGSYSAYARDLSSITPANGFTITGDPLRATCSLSNIGPLGDINADGYADYVVAVSLVRSSIYPAYYVLYGGPVANNIDLGALTSSQGLVIAPSANYADMFMVAGVVPLEKHLESNWFNASDFTRDKEDQLKDFHEELKRKEKKKDKLDVVENRVSQESNDDYYYYYYGEDLCPNATVFVDRVEIVPPTEYTSDLSQYYLPVTAAGDLNGDGLEDILVTGEIRADQANFTFFVIYGSASLPSAIYLDQFSYSMGYTLAADEVSFPPLMYTYQYWLNTTTVCSVNQTTGITTRIDIDYQYNYTTTFHAATFSGAGDMNGDGYADLVLGSSYASNYAGQAFVVYGSGQTYNSSIVLSQMTSQQGYRIYGAGKWIYPNYGDRIGFDVSGNFDFNGDGYRDIIVGVSSTPRPLPFPFIFSPLPPFSAGSSHEQLVWLGLRDLRHLQPAQAALPGHSAVLAGHRTLLVAVLALRQRREHRERLQQRRLRRRDHRGKLFSSPLYLAVFSSLAALLLSGPTGSLRSGGSGCGVHHLRRCGPREHLGQLDDLLPGHGHRGHQEHGRLRHLLPDRLDGERRQRLQSRRHSRRGHRRKRLPPSSLETLPEFHLIPFALIRLLTSISPRSTSPAPVT
jgi:hypothetical protein